MISFKKGKEPFLCFNNNVRSNIEYNNEPFKCAEAAWQAQKCANPDERSCFFLLAAPAARRLGEVVNVRPDWEEVKYDIMVEVLTAKFEQNKEFREVLLSTEEEEIVFDTTGWHDNTWGMCSCAKCRIASSQNLLGKALVQVRTLLREKS